MCLTHTWNSDSCIYPFMYKENQAQRISGKDFLDVIV